VPILPPPNAAAPGSTSAGAGGSDQAGIRAANLALVTRTVFAATEPPTRADVAHTTAMTRSTVSRLVDDLVSGGVLTELEPVARAGPGRRGTPLVPHGGRFAALGLQVNVGYLAAVVVDLAGAVRSRRVAADDLRSSDPAAVLDRLAQRAVGPTTAERPVASDLHEVGVLWFGQPLVICDVYEHAYYVDYQNKKADYVGKFLEHINWDEVNRRWQATG